MGNKNTSGMYLQIQIKYTVKDSTDILCHHFQQYFSYIVAVNFIGGGNWNTRRKPLTNFIT
jgi:hypothetical protein